MRSWLRSPLFWILLVAAGLRLTGLFWGLPSSDGWDDDGFAPRNFLTALVLTWKPGSYFTYPPLHALLLALPSLPVAGWALMHAPSLHQHDVIATITQPGYMTYFSVVARLVAIAMSLGIIASVGEMTRLVAGPRAGLLAAGAAALNFGLTYYGQVSNLDVPYLFWALLSLLFVMQAVTLQQMRRFWWAAFAAAAAVATKDQAYALFLLGLPLFLALWFAVDAWPRANARRVLTTLALAAVAAIVALLLVDGGITNPSGFIKRVAFLTGPASRDYMEYARGIAGWWALLRNMFAYYCGGHGLTAVVLAGLGVALVARRRGVALAIALLPLLAIISFTICFNFAALRSDARFLLPQAVLACVYIGITAEALIFPAKAALRWVGRAAVAAVALIALHQAMAVDAAMLLDPRYDAEAWLARNAYVGDTVEIYDRNWILPRFPTGLTVLRVGMGEVTRRNPLPGVTELQQPYNHLLLRHPRFIIVSGNWLERYLPVAPQQGRIRSPNQLADLHDKNARFYFDALVNGQLGYQMRHLSRPHTGIWPVAHLHDSLNEPLAIFEHGP